jgi:probable LLM family oxidoreductase
MQLGVYTFADLVPDPKTKKIISPEQRMKNLIEEGIAADEAGLDIFGIGEHHREDFLISSPVVPLAAIAAKTKHIRLTSAVNVLSSDDPIRVFQDFAELDLISNGRAELMVGRGSFTESFPLFGYSLNDYDELFEEKLYMLLKIRDSEKLTWSGTYTPTINNRGVYPRPVQNPFPISLAVGGNPPSIIRAASLGLPLALAIIGGEPQMFAPLINLYREAYQKFAHNPKNMSVSINSQGFIAENSEQAKDIYWPYYESVMNQIGKERGWPNITKDSFAASASPAGSLLLGNPKEVADKIIAQHKLFAQDRFIIQIDVGTMPHDKVLKAIELLGKEVAPLVKAAI